MPGTVTSSHVQEPQGAAREERLMRDNGWAQGFALAAELGFTIACPMVVFIGGGVWLDSKLHTNPWLMVAGILLAVLAAGAGFWQFAKSSGGPSQKGGKGSSGGTAAYKVEGQDAPPESETGMNRAETRRRDGL